MKKPSPLYRRLLTAALLSGALVGAGPAFAQQPNIYGLTSGGSLVRFNAATPGTFDSTLPITGVTTGQALVGMDVRPATGQLYVLGYNPANGQSRLYTINPATGVATAVGAAPFVLNLGTPTVGVPTAALAAMDFNPVVDRIRVVGANRTNYRLNPNDGTLVANDGTLTYVDGDVNAGRTPNVRGVAYNNSFFGATTTTLYAGDLKPFTQNVPPSNASEIRLSTINPPNAGTLNTVQMGTQNNVIDLDFDVYFDPATNQQTAWASAVYGIGSPAFFGNGLGVIDLEDATIAPVGAGALGGQPTANPVVDIAVQLPVQSVWNGAVSTDYGNPLNWTPNAVPTGTDNIMIPAGTPNVAVVTDARAANKVTINSGAMFTVANAGVFTVNGNVINGGTFQAPNAGTVVLGGAAIQTLDGAGTYSLENLTVGSNGAQFSATATGALITQVLTLNGSLATNGKPLVLSSSAAGTAMVVNNGGTVLGSATVQRYIDPSSAPGPGYRHFSAPVATTFADLAAPGFVPVVNAAYNTAPNPLSVSPYPNIFGYNEARFPTSSDFSRGYFSPTALGDPMTPGRAYSVYMAGTVKPDFVGTLNNGNVSVPNLTKTGNFNLGTQKSGWHLLGNPYPSPIDWDLVTVPAGLSPSISIYRSTGGQNGVYTQFVNGVGAPGTDLVPMAGGFFARVLSGTPTLTFTNACRVTSYANPSHYRGSDARPTAHLTLRRAGQPLDAADEAWIYFEEGATAGLDRQFDADKLRAEGEAASIFTLSRGAELAVNGLPLSEVEAATVPLGIVTPVAGTYELTLAELRGFTAAVVLFDRLTGTEYDLALQPVVRFTVTRPGEDLTRFSLRFGRGAADAPALTTLSLDVYPNPTATADGLRVNVSGAAAETVEATLFDVLGRPVARQTLAVRDQLATGTLPLRGLTRGTYVLRVQVPGSPALTRSVTVE